MNTAPEITCTACNQRLPIDRGVCPYCSNSVKSCWFEDQGNIKRAVTFSENGQDYIFIDGKKLPLANVHEIPYAFKFMMDIQNRQPKGKYYRLVAQAFRIFFDPSYNLWSESNNRLPAKWDTWLDKQ